MYKLFKDSLKKKIYQLITGTMILFSIYVGYLYFTDGENYVRLIMYLLIMLMMRLSLIQLLLTEIAENSQDQ